MRITGSTSCYRRRTWWPTFTTRSTLTEEISAQVFSKERRRLQAQPLWMVVNLLVDRMYVKAPTGKSKEDLDALLFDRVARRNRTDSYDEKKYRGAGISFAGFSLRVCAVTRVGWVGGISLGALRALRNFLANSLETVWRKFCFDEILETSFYCICKFSVMSVET